MLKILLQGLETTSNLLMFLYTLNSSRWHILGSVSKKRKSLAGLRTSMNQFNCVMIKTYQDLKPLTLISCGLTIAPQLIDF